MKRDEKTLEVETYANRLPKICQAASASFWIRPQPVTTIVAQSNYLFDRGAKDVTCVCLLAYSRSLKVLEGFVGDRADVTVIVASG